MPQDPRPRDPERIDPMIETLRKAWHKYPDLRLGPLVDACAAMAGGNADAFNIEDDRLLQGIKKLI